MSAARRALSLLLVVALAVAGSAAGPVAAVPDARLAVADVTVTPGTPTVGAQVVVDATVRNSAGSPSPVELTQVELRGPGGVRASADGVGSLSPGDTLAVPLATAFDEPGAQVLTLHVEGRTADGTRVSVDRPVPVTVESAPPQVAVRTGPAAVDSPTRVAVTVGNPTTAPLRDVAVRLADPVGRANRSAAFVPTLPAGAETTVNLSTVPDAAGERTLRVAVNYTDASGVERRAAREVRLRVAEHVADLGVEVRRAPSREADDQAVPGGLSGLVGGGGGAVGGGGESAAETDSPPTRFVVEVTNFGTVRAGDVVVTPVAGDRRLPRQRLDAALAPGESGSVTVDLADVTRSGPVEFRIDYRAGTQPASTATTLDYRPRVAGLELTDVDVVRTGNGSLAVSGNVVNVGRGPARGVVVEVVRGGNVTPVYPERRYFVGELDGSDFAPFDLTARTTASVDEVQVRIVAREDGEASTRTVALPVPPADGGDGGVPVGLVVLAVGLPLAALVGVGVRRRRGGE
jgi:hypothetical protein